MSQQKPPLEIHGIPINIYGGFWLRVLALLLDTIIMIIPLATVLMINNISRVYYFYTFVPFQILALWYYIYLPKVYGGTPGKLLIGLKIIRLDGRDLSWPNAVLRYLPLFLLGLLSAAIFISGLLKMDDETFSEYTWMTRTKYLNTLSPVLYNIYLLIDCSWILGEVISLLANKRKMALHDLLAGTVVVKEKYIAPLREIMNGPAEIFDHTSYVEPEKSIATDHERFMPK